MDAQKPDISPQWDGAAFASVDPVNHVPDPPLTEADVVRRAMIHTMRLYNADDLNRDPEVFKQTVLDTLELVKAQSKSQGIVLANHEHSPLSVAEKPAAVQPEKFKQPRLPPLVSTPKLDTAPDLEDPKPDSGADSHDEDEEDEEWMRDVENRQHTSTLGRLLIPIITSRVFEWTVLFAIGLNCVQLSEYFRLHPYTNDMEDWLDVTNTVIEVILWAIFSTELVLKLLALGLNLYFSNSWNCLDAFILVAGYIGFIPGVGELTFFRVLRIVRPLRIVGRLQGMKIILETIKASMRPLFDTVLLSCLLFFIFGIVGLQLFQGAMNRRCYTGDSSTGYTLDTSISRLCGGEFSCPSTHTCIFSDESPNFSTTNFNNIPDCFLTIFVAITLEGWTDVLYQLQDSFSWWPATIYFILLVLFGSLFTLNLALAVISDTYADMIGDDEEEEEGQESEEQEAEGDPEITPRVALKAPNKDTEDGRRSFQQWMHLVATASWLENTITGIIIANTVTLSMEYVDSCVENGIDQACKMPTAYADTLTIFNYLFIGIFTIELIIKLIGLGLRAYVQDRYNLFDCLVVIVSYVELLLDGNASLSVIRTFRLARVLKLAKNWTSLRDLLDTILDTLPAVGYLSILLGLFMFISAIGGMAFFGNKFNPPDLEATPRETFDNFFKAMLTVFQILTGENWNTVLYNAIKVSAGGMEWAAAIFIVGMFATGNFLLLNLFLAILLQNFGDSEPPDMSLGGIADVCGCFGDGPDHRVAPADGDDQEDVGAVKLTHSCAAMIALNKIKKKAQMNRMARLYNPERSTGPELLGESLWIFTPSNALQVLLANLVAHPVFENFILLCIVASSVTLAMDAPDLDSDSDLKSALDGLDYFFVAVFTTELVIKVVVMGFVFCPRAYMKDGWNILDFVIVVSSLLAVSLEDSSLGVLRVLRTLRTLRPLRMIRRAPGLKCVVDAIFGCMPAFLNISLVCTLVYLVFAIMGVQLWAGKFWSCNDTSVNGVTECVGTYTVDGVSTAREWTNTRQNFDNVLNGLLSLFEVASLELWLDIMYFAMDAPDDLGEQPRQNQNGAAALYFVVFIIIGSFLMLNLFVGAVVDNFSKVKEEAGRSAAMTEEQDAFVKSIRTMLNNKPSSKPTPPQGARGSAHGGSAFYKLRHSCFKFTQYDWRTGKPTKLDETSSFDLVILSLIVLNVLIMSLYTWEQPTFPTLASSDVDAFDFQSRRTLNSVVEVANTVFVWLFFGEAVLKLLALGSRQYFSYGMNIFDFIVVVVSLVGFVITVALSDVNSSVLGVIMVVRALRVVRTLRLVTRVKGVKRLLETLLYTLPGLCNVSLLTFMVLFVYTVLGMNFFGEQSLGTGPFQMYNEHANFRNFANGFVTLFRMSTGESWNGIMHDCMVDTGPAAWVFYVSYMIIGSYLMFNLLIAVLLDEFSMAQAQESHKVSPDMIEAYCLVWRDLDPKATHFIACDMLPQLLKHLEKPLGAGTSASAAEVMVMMQDLNLRVSNGQAHFVETFMALVLAAYQVETMDPHVYNAIVDDLLDSFPTLAEVDPKAEKEAIATFAAIKLQSVARGFRTRKSAAVSGWAATLDELGVSPNSSFSAGFALAAKKQKSPQSLDADNPLAA